MKAVFVAGGTGGHVYPALEIARESKKFGVEIHWIGKEGSLEKELSLKEGFNIQNKGLTDHTNFLHFVEYNDLINNEYSIPYDLRGNPRFLTVGSITNRKGQVNFINLLPEIIKKYPRAHYHCVGLKFEEKKLHFRGENQ